MDIFKILGIFWEIVRKFFGFFGIFGGIFWEFYGNFLEDFFCRNAYGGIFLGGFFWEKFFGRIFLRGLILGGIFWEEFFVYIVKVIWIWKGLIYLSRFWFLSRFCLNARKKDKKCGGKLIALKNVSPLESNVAFCFLFLPDIFVG